MHFANIDSLTAYFSLLMAQLSLFRERKNFQWASFTLIAITLALSHALITMQALIPILGLLILHLVNQKDAPPITRPIILTAIFLLSFSLIHHLWPSFHNPTIQTDSSKVFTIPFDTPFVALFLMQWGGVYWWSWKQLRPLIRESSVLLLSSAILSLAAGILLGVLHFQPLWTITACKTFLIYTLFILLPEEIFCRGFIQREVFYTIPPNTTSQSFLALSLSVLFSILALNPIHVPWSHASWGSLFILTSIQFTTGTIYQNTHSIEVAIMYRILIQAVLFFLFQWL